MLERSLKKYRARVPTKDQDERLLAAAEAAIKAAPAKFEKAKAEKAKSEAEKLKTAQLEFEKAIVPDQAQHDTLAAAAMDFFGPRGHHETSPGQSYSSKGVGSTLGRSEGDPRVSYVKVKWAELDRDDCGGMGGATVVVLQVQPGKFSYAGKPPWGIERSAGLRR